jgi:hypothetical protein
MAINFGVENRRSAEGQEGEVTADRVSFDEGTTWTEHGTRNMKFMKPET